MLIRSPRLKLSLWYQAVMGEAFQIRRATREDAPEIAHIHVEATRNAYRGIYTDETGGTEEEVIIYRWRL